MPELRCKVPIQREEDMSGLIALIEDKEIVAGVAGEIGFEIELAGRAANLSFVHKHLLALKAGIKAIDECEE